MNTTTVITFEKVLDAARRGDWTFVDEHIGGFINMNQVLWALNVGRKDGDEKVRDFATTILCESNVLIMGSNMHHKLEDQMQNDPNDIVKLRLAVALWKRGYRPDSVKTKMQEALVNKDVGETARKWENTHLKATA